MKKKNELFLGYLSIIYAMTLLFILVNNFAGRKEEKWRFFYAFTQQSNILLLIWFILFGVYAFTNKVTFVKNRILMTALTVYISITYFIVALVLDPVYAGVWIPTKSGNELWLHHLSPIIMWIYFFKVKGEGNLNVKNALLSLIYPFIYFIFNLIIGANFTYLDGKKAYAYSFINPDTYGGNYFILSLLILGLLFAFSLFTFTLTKLKLYVDENYHIDES